MQLKIESVHLGAVAVIKQELFKDQRGFFTEVFREDQFKEMGLPHRFVQDNHSGSVKGVTRGLHFQWEPPMGKLMRVTKGEAFLVAVDIRKGSPTLGRWFGKIANEDDKIQIWAPANFARGFCVLSDYAEIQYKVSGMYNSRSESGIRWNDPEIGIEWPVKNPILSEKDTNARTLNEWLNSAESDYFIYDPNQDIK
jgi:dTDP-4-dehydrorhamnose 3,5-epimerase